MAMRRRAQECCDARFAGMTTERQDIEGRFCTLGGQLQRLKRLLKKRRKKRPVGVCLSRDQEGILALLRRLRPVTGTARCGDTGEGVAVRGDLLRNCRMPEITAEDRVAFRSGDNLCHVLNPSRGHTARFWKSWTGTRCFV